MVRLTFHVESTRGDDKMPKNWMDDLFQEKERRRRERADERQAEMLQINKLVALSRPIWEQIKNRLLDTVEAFNARVESGNKITTVTSTTEFSIQFKSERGVQPFVVTFTPVAGTINCYVPFSRRAALSWLTVTVKEDGSYAIQRHLLNGKKEDVRIEQIDEIILKDYFASYL